MRCEWKSVLPVDVAAGRCARFPRARPSTPQRRVERGDGIVRGRTPKQNVDAGGVFSGPHSFKSESTIIEMRRD